MEEYVEGLNFINTSKPFKPVGIYYDIIDKPNNKICTNAWGLSYYTINSDCFINISEKNKDKILSITTTEDLDLFNTTYSIGCNLHTGICWDVVSTDYAGLEICQEFASLRGKYVWLQPFDINCGCIWNITMLDYLEVADSI